MSHPFSRDTTQIIELPVEINSQFEESMLKGILEDLPGVKKVEFPDNVIQVRFDPFVVGEQRFFNAIRDAGFTTLPYRRRA